jgi:predicted dinucleotide-binding enzyme
MKIGIIGTGNMGRTLGKLWAGTGHEVLFGSRDPRKAEATATTASARFGDMDAAAAFGDVLLYTARGVAPAQLLREPSALRGKIVIDCNNSDADPERAGEFLPAPVPSYAEQLAALAPEARVVQAFNTVPHRVLELSRERIEQHRLSVLVCSDDVPARQLVLRLAADLGFVGVDCGELRRSRLVDGVVDFIRFQIAAMGLGPMTALSLLQLDEVRA